MIPALAGVFSKLDGLTRFLAPFLPAPQVAAIASAASAAASYPPISASRRNWAVIASSVGCASSAAPALFR
jgi:hypothetical protein